MGIIFVSPVPKLWMAPRVFTRKQLGIQAEERVGKIAGKPSVCPLKPRTPLRKGFLSFQNRARRTFGSPKNQEKAPTRTLYSLLAVRTTHQSPTETPSTNPKNIK
jgi:hypothetical protein